MRKTTKQMLNDAYGRGCKNPSDIELIYLLLMVMLIILAIKQLLGGLL